MNWIVSVERTNGRPTRVVCRCGGVEVAFGPGPTVLSRSAPGRMVYSEGVTYVPRQCMAEMTRQAAAVFKGRPANVRPRARGYKQLEFSGSFA